MTATETYYQRRIAELEAQCRWVERISAHQRDSIDRMVTRCNEGCNSTSDRDVYAAYASVLGALNDLSAPTGIEQTFVEAEPGDVVHELTSDWPACCDGTHTNDCTGPCPDPDDVRDAARERRES